MFARRSCSLEKYGSQQRGEQDRGSRRENPGEDDGESSSYQKLPEVVSYLHTRRPSFDLDLTCLYPPPVTYMRAGPKPGRGLACFDPGALYLIALALPRRLVCPSYLPARCHGPRWLSTSLDSSAKEEMTLATRYLTGVFNWLCVAGMKP